MEKILWAGLVVNALINARIAILMLQDGQDRVNAGVARAEETHRWDGFGYLTLMAWVAFSPAVTAVWLIKKTLFPRGIKSKFAKEQEAKRAQQAAERILQEQELERQRLFKEAQAILVDWAPGTIVAAPQALGWEAAADAFDAAADQVARDKGRPWIPSDPQAQLRDYADLVSRY